MKRCICYLLLILLIAGCDRSRKTTTILYFTPTEAGEDIKELKALCDVNSWNLVATNDVNFFQDSALSQISTVILSYSYLNNVDYKVMPALQRYLEAGGGVLTVRDTVFSQEGWSWLKGLNDTVDVRQAVLKNGRLASLKPNYTGEALKEALGYTIGKNTISDFSKATTLNFPDSSRYTQIVLTEGLDEPMQMVILPNNNVLFVERKGGVKMYDASANNIKTIASFDVFSGIEDGLLGVVLDPDFKNNQWIYFYYAPAGNNAVDRLSRFNFAGDSLALESEKILLEVPTQRTYCCHSAGGIAFGPDGLLYVSVGDNTNADDPYKEGVQPIDERPGHELADGQGTAANTNDLRGSIIRIKPEPDGTYSIPEGNLFPKGTPKTKPEIYVMGLRNPFRFTVDMKSNFLYWGEVGPDTKFMSSEGVRMSYDELNLAKKPGFYGWPYFLANNEIFPIYNFATKVEAPGKDPANPSNESRNNTGIRELPPAQPAMIWYGKDASKKFPMVGSGGASLMSGPVYYSDLFPGASYKLSNYYNGKLLIYEWIRNWIMAVTLDEEGNYLRMEPLLPNMQFTAPIDLKFGPDGALYVLEYGTNWFSKNANARLVRIEYQEGNRSPVAVAEADKLHGEAPLTVEFSGKNSVDYDGDRLTYSWKIDNKELKGESVEHTFTKTGKFEVGLTVTDEKGGKGVATLQVLVGNTPPEIQILTTANSSFYWNDTSFDYNVIVKDKEDSAIDPADVQISFGYLPSKKDIAVILSGNYDAGSLKYAKGKQFIADLNCTSCHSMNQESVGPAFMAVAERYVSNAGVVKSLAEKIIKGGSGVWGDRPMSPHPTLSQDNAVEIVNYILSLSGKGGRIPLQGKFDLKEHWGKSDNGGYLLDVNYVDKGANGIESLQDRKSIILQNARVQAEDFDFGNVSVSSNTINGISYTYASGINSNSYLSFKNIDLTHIKRLQYLVRPKKGGSIELRLDSVDGPLIATTLVSAESNNKAEWTALSTPLKETKGQHNLYFVFKEGANGDKHLFDLDWMYFSK